MFDIAFSILVPVFLGLFIGQYLDKIYSPKFPLWTLICAMLGMIAGLWSVYKRHLQ